MRRRKKKESVLSETEYDSIVGVPFNFLGPELGTLLSGVFILSPFGTPKCSLPDLNTLDAYSEYLI